MPGFNNFSRAKANHKILTKTREHREDIGEGIKRKTLSIDVAVTKNVKRIQQGDPDRECEARDILC